MSLIKEAIAASGGVPGAFGKGDPVGKQVEGRIVSATIIHSRDLVTGNPEYWPSDDPAQPQGRPKQKVAIVIQTNERDPQREGDDGRRGVYIKMWGDQWRSMVKAVEDAGDDDIRPGGYFGARFVGIEPATQKGMSDAKIMEYRYQKPGALAGQGGIQSGEQVNQSTGEITPAQQPAQQQQVQQPVAQQPAAPAEQPASAPAQFDTAMVQNLIAVGLDDNKINELTGAPVPAIAAIRSMPRT